MTPAVYVDVFERLERDHVRYVVVGGMAVVLHGYIRPVADLDIVIDPTINETNRAMHTLMLAGFMPSIPLSLSAVTVMRMFDHSQREIDVFVRFLFPFDELWVSSERVQLGDSFARVMALDHLLREKRLNRGPRDLLDIEGLLALEGSSSNHGTEAHVHSDE